MTRFSILISFFSAKIDILNDNSLFQNQNFDNRIGSLPPNPESRRALAEEVEVALI